MSESMGPRGTVTGWAHEMHSPDAARREEAARQIWLRFAARLRGVVRRRLDPRLLRRAGEEDVLQSLFASFFGAAPGPNGPPKSRADLWRQLVHFTMCKVANTAERHRAQRRDVRREQPMGDPAESGHGGAEPADPRWLSSEDALVAKEEFARLRATLPEDFRPVFDLRLEGYTNAEIAAQIGRVERTVELKLKAIRALLGPELGIVPPGPTADQAEP
jgi:RNA polymerase sigma-70 factor (ECF subfamily)